MNRPEAEAWSSPSRPDPGHLNPAITTSGAVHTASELFYNGLLSIDETLHAKGDLAESWTVGDNGMRYTFTLRDGVKWHDGEPFTSADVKFTFDEALLKFHARTRTSLGGSLASITPDPRTVVFRFKEPYAPLLNQLDVTEAPIIPRHVYEGTDIQRDPANTAPIGTGPFRFVSYDPGSEIRAARNPDYFKPGLPYLDEVVQRVITDDTTQLLALEGGEVDYVWNVPGADIGRVEANDDIEIERTSFNPGGANCIMTISFNLQRPVFQDVRVRQACSTPLIAASSSTRSSLVRARSPRRRSRAGFPSPTPPASIFPHSTGHGGSPMQDAGWRRGRQRAACGPGRAGSPRWNEVRDRLPAFPHLRQVWGVGAPVAGSRRHRGQPAAIGARGVPERRIQGSRLRHQHHLLLQRNGSGDRRTPDVRLQPDRAHALHQRRGVPEREGGPAVRAGQPNRRPGRRGELYREAQQIVADELPYVWVVETVGTRGFRASCSGFKVFTGLFAETASCSDQ